MNKKYSYDDNTTISDKKTSSKSDNILLKHDAVGITASTLPS